MDQDFAGYMENLAAAQAEQEEQEAMLQAHEVWRQTTWSGWLVRQIQSIQNHFKPFFHKALDLINDEESLGQIIVFNIVRLLCLFIVIGAVYSLAMLFQKIIGTEYVVEEEVVIVHEHKSEADARKVLARGDGAKLPPQQMQSDNVAAKQGKGGRDKKFKSS